jgi:hypothetical protein
MTAAAIPIFMGMTDLKKTGEACLAEAGIVSFSRFFAVKLLKGGRVNFGVLLLILYNL